MHRALRLAFIVVGISAAAATGSLAQQDMSDVQIETIRVADGIYMLVGQGGNIGLSIGDDGPFVCQTFAAVEKIVPATVLTLNLMNGLSGEFLGKLFKLLF